MSIFRNYLVTCLLILAGCAPAEEKKSAESRPVQVKVQPAETREFRIPVRATGLLGTATEMKLSFKTGGIVKKIEVREGQSVSRGEVLAVLDLSEIQAQVSQAGIGLEKAQRDLDRARNLYRDSVATLEQYQNARSAYELAVAQKEIADFNLQHSQIRAPSAGKIEKILVEASEVAGPGYPVILFASTENDWVVRATLTDKDIVKLSIGDSAMVRMDAFPGRTFSGEVTELGAVADPVTGTYESEVLIHRADPQFRSGFISRVEIYPAHVVRSLVVPMEALLDASDYAAHVFIFDQGVARKRRIRTGQVLGDHVAVLEGIEEGELVITEGAKYLREDAAVNAVNLNNNRTP
jgi:multidrug efflux system membrane fusion protein